MKLDISRRVESSPIEIDSVAASIVRTQKASGEIPWSEGGKTDPWDHVEAAMGLNIGGYFKQARSAFEWLAGTQLKDGSWWASYRDGIPEDTTKDANMASYIAVGVFHYYLITDDVSFLEEMWPTVKSAIEYTIALQAPSGEIYWARNHEGIIDPMALLTGSSSIYMSIKCALEIASRLGISMPGWNASLKRLGDAIRYRPSLFNISKSRYSMDWYYPVLCGAITGIDAQKRIDKSWNKFVVEGLGIRCVSDQPWITIAETSELTMALAAMGNFKEAEVVFNWIQDKKYDDGSYWCGLTFPDMVIWTEERLTWTAGAVLLAADTLNDITPASQLFSHNFWNNHELLHPIHTKG
ncbi:MAG: phenyltransferase domain-containing protein, partial [Thermodesulfobacteriota bacterium]|nr:phenyltransferase domain-containing protein [Thermodesulfobacteriota bacterium]